MNTTETSKTEQNSEPKKSHRGALIFAIVMGLGLFALIALNMR